MRAAKPSDAKVIVALIDFLGHAIDEKSVRKNIAKLVKAGEAPLVATIDKQVVGLCGVHRMVDRPSPRPGRTDQHPRRRQGSAGPGHRPNAGRSRRAIAAEGRLQLVEVTSNDRRTAAHAFYRHIGYERTSIRFFKKL